MNKLSGPEFTKELRKRFDAKWKELVIETVELARPIYGDDFVDRIAKEISWVGAIVGADLALIIMKEMLTTPITPKEEKAR